MSWEKVPAELIEFMDGAMAALSLPAKQSKPCKSR